MVDQFVFLQPRSYQSLTILTLCCLFFIIWSILFTHVLTYLYLLYIYIYNYEWKNWYIKLEITMTRKSGTHLHVTYGALNSCFDPVRSHQQCTLWSPPLEIEPTTTFRSRNSTTGPLVHATYKRCRINKSW